MFDKLRTQIARELAGHRIGVLTAAGELGPQAVPVQYHLVGLEVECLLPRWSELAYAVAASGPVVLVVLSAPDSEQRWVRYQGTATLVAPPSTEPAPDERYTVIRIRPSRIDLFDEQRGWGARETLDLEIPQQPEE